MHLRLSISVDKPIQEVFERFADPEFTARVDRNTYGATLLSGKPLSKGAVWKLKLRAPLVGSMQQTQTYTEVDAPYRFAMEIDQRGWSGKEVETFEVGANGAVDVTWDANWKLDWYATPFYLGIRWMVKSGAEVWLADMKQAIESGKDPGA